MCCKNLFEKLSGKEQEGSVSSQDFGERIGEVGLDNILIDNPSNEGPQDAAASNAGFGLASANHILGGSGGVGAVPRVNDISDPSTNPAPAGQETDSSFSALTSGPGAEAVREAEAMRTAQRLHVKMIDLEGEFNERPEWADAFLARYYAEFIESFPDIKERPPLDVLREHLIAPDSGFRIFAFEIDGEVVGGQHLRMVTTAEETFGVIEHLWVSKVQRQAGIGSVVIQMSEQVLEAQGAKFCIAEFNDPVLMTADERAEDLRSGITPEGRLRFWERQGYSLLNAPYIQPSLNPTEDAVEYLMLGVKPLRDTTDIGPTMESGRLLRGMHAYFGAFAPNYLSDRRVVQMLGDIAGRDYVEVLPLGSPRTFRQFRPLQDENATPLQ